MQTNEAQLMTEDTQTHRQTGDSHEAREILKYLKYSSDDLVDKLKEIGKATVLMYS